MESIHFECQLSNSLLRGEYLKSSIKKTEKSKRLLLLHGAGVAGDLTWRFILHNIYNYWDEILVPDLPGMGGSNFLDHQHRHPVEDYLKSIEDLIAEFNWDSFYLGGYSFGGLLSIHLAEYFPLEGLFLIEPAALLSRDKVDLKLCSDQYRNTAEMIYQTPDSLDAYMGFLNLVSSNRLKDEKKDRLAIRRMMSRGTGLADGLYAVSKSLENYLDYYQSWVPPVPGCSIVGSLTSQKMHDRNQGIANQNETWHYYSIDNADHSLVFAHPKSIAKAIEGCFSKQLDICT